MGQYRWTGLAAENVVCMLNYSSYRPVRETQTREQITIPSVPLFFLQQQQQQHGSKEFA